MNSARERHVTQQAHSLVLLLESMPYRKIWRVSACKNIPNAQKSRNVTMETSDSPGIRVQPSKLSRSVSDIVLLYAKVLQFQARQDVVA